MQVLAKGFQYTTLGIRPTFVAYTQPSSIGYISVPYISPGPYATPGFYATPGLYVISADYTQLLTGPAYLAVYHPLSANQLPLVTLITSIGHGRELLNLAKIYIINAKYSGQNDSFILNLANL